MESQAETFRVGRHDVPVAPWISAKVRVGPSPGRGSGLFATTAVAAGEVVLVWGGRWYVGPVEEAAARAEGHATMQWDADLFSREDDEDHPAFAINHSCDPNVWFHDTFHLTARWDIAPGEEITIDYAMLGGEEDHRSEWTCRCGALDCRGTIRGTDWMLPALRDRYSGHFIPFVNRKIAGIAPEAAP